jgi:hypothetical protein
MSISTRVTAVERALGAAASQRRAYSFVQLARVAEHLRRNRTRPADWEGIVGPPELVIGTYETSPAELICVTVAMNRRRMATGSAGGPDRQPPAAA